MTLTNYIEILKSSKEPRIQLDFFRDNGQVLIQIFKQRDVLTWGLDIDLVDSNGLIIELAFNKAKKSNKQNYIRFTESEIFKNFTYCEKGRENSYFAGIPSKWSTKEIYNFISKIINEIYDIGNSSITYTLNAY